MSQTSELRIPDVAKEDPNSFEIVRVWIARNGQHVSLRTEVWDDPAAWGVMLADLAKHVANTFQQGAGFDRIAALRRIRAALIAELDAPTDDPSGKISDNTK